MNIITSPRIALCFLILPLSTSLLSAQPIIDKSQGVKRLTTKNYSYRDGGLRQKLEKQVYMEYNDLANPTKQILYDVDSMGIPAKSKQTVFNYDRYNRLLSTNRFNSENVLEQQEEFFYNTNGQRVRVEYTDFMQDESKQTTYSVYTYDSYGNKSKVETYDQAGLQYREQGWTYNEANDIESSYLWENAIINGEFVRRRSATFNKFDREGNLMSSSIENSDGYTLTKEVRNFENNYISEFLRYTNGQLVSRFSKDALTPKGDPKTNTAKGIEPPIPYQDEFSHPEDFRTEWAINYVYDDNGKPILTEKTVGGQVVSSYKFEYDENGNLTKTTRIFRDQNLTEETFAEYDDHNSKISESLYRNGNIVSKNTYQYDYYKKKQ